MMLLKIGAEEVSKSAAQQWVETVSGMIGETGWPGGAGELALLIVGVTFFLLQFHIFIKRAFFSEKGARAVGKIIEVGEKIDRLALAEIAFHSPDGRRFLITDRDAYEPRDKGAEIIILYAPENPQRAKVRKPSAAAAKQFLIGGAASAACAFYGYLPVLNMPAGG